MDPSEIDALVQRLVANPHDEQALAYAHQAGAADPKSYAHLLERVGTETSDPSYASHWLSESAQVWATTLGDVHRAARILMQAIDRDPTQRTAAERLAQLYREKGDIKALAALLERRVKALSAMADDAPIRLELAAMHEELGRLWNESFLQPKKAVENFRRALELDSGSAYALYGLREVYKAQGQLAEALPFYEAEIQLEQDSSRQVALLRDEASLRRELRDFLGATQCLSRARMLDGNDPVLQQEFASIIIERLAQGEIVSPHEKTVATELLVNLAETYDGEHGLAYASGALDIEPGHDRALQLFVYYARTLGHDDQLVGRYLRYVEVNPSGELSAEARHVIAQSYEAAGDFTNAIDVLEPLRALGDTVAQARLRELQTRAANGQAMPAKQDGEIHIQQQQQPVRRASALPSDKLQGALDAAQMLANKGKKQEACAKYKEILESDPAHPEALAWVEDFLRGKRDYAQLRDVLLAAVRSMPNVAESVEARKERLREVAGLCEGNIRDTDGAIAAWKQLLAIDRADEAARNSLTRLLERSQRWDDLANLLEQEATIEHDPEKKIFLEKKLAAMQETKRRDFVGAAEAWSRIARLVPEDDRAIATASKLFEKAGDMSKAAEVIAEHVTPVSDAIARGMLFERLAELREHLADHLGAGTAFSEAAALLSNPKLWESSERCFVSGEHWQRAAEAAEHRAQMSGDSKQQAQHFARAAEHLSRAGDDESALARLEQATHLDPTSEEYAAELTERYTQGGKWAKLARLLASRGDRMLDRQKRIALRRQAANLYASQLADKESARDQWLKVLEDGDDREALEKLVEDAIERGDHTEATTILRRLANTTADRSEKARIALREAELLAEGVGDIDTAIARYESILSDLDVTCRPALQAIADLQEARDNSQQAADALERELKLIADVQERGQIAARLARLYERMDDPRNAIRALDLVRKADLEDFDALTRLCELCEKTEQWDRVGELLAERIEVEADDIEIASMTKKLAHILADKLDRGDEALAALTEIADQGNAEIRGAYVELGDKLGWKAVVAGKLVEWWLEARPSAERTENLRGAFDRFTEIGRDQEAVRVGIEIVRAKGADKEIIERLEHLAVKTGDLDALSFAHDLRVRDLSGAERAEELVRQAEARVRAGGAGNDAVQHAEAGLINLQVSDLEPLLARLSNLAESHNDVVDLYERQISRSRAPGDRVRALGRAAQVAASRGQLDRARNFLELGLSGAPTDDAIALLEVLAREADEKSGNDRVLRIFCSALAGGGHGARDGGKTRAALLRRAATIAYRDLHDTDQAFSWLTDALVVHTETLTLDTLESWCHGLQQLERADAVLSRALTEVFDGPLVRQLLSRRAKLRREHLNDRSGAAADLKKLHDLSPNEGAVMEELSRLLTELGDYRGMVQLYEDQILRGRDVNHRAELARIVARIWEEQLKDEHEAADAWRRVLRMRPNDPEATAGLERAKTRSLKEASDASIEDYVPPKWPSMQPPAPSNAPPPLSVSPAPPPVSLKSDFSLAPDTEVISGKTHAGVNGVETTQKELEDSQSTLGGGGDQKVVLDSVSGKPMRPEDLAFRRSSPDDVTMSAPLTGELLAAIHPIDSSLLERTEKKGPESLGTLQASYDQSAYDEELTKTGEGPPPSEMTDTATALTRGREFTATDVASASPGPEDEEDIIIIADDMAEIIEIDETTAIEEPRRITPPPLPRG